MFKFKEYDYKSFSLSVMVIIITLSSIGIFLIERLQDEDEAQFEKQIIGLIFGLVCAIIISMIDYHFWAKNYIILYIFNLALLLFCRFTDKSSGLPIYGRAYRTAKRWITFNFGAGRSIDFMPSELTKVIMIIVYAQLLTLLFKKINKIYVTIILVIVMAIPVALVLTQTDLSTSIVLFACFAFIYFASGVTYKIILPIVLAGIPIMYGLLWYIQQDYQLLLEPYQQNRVLALLHPDQYSDTMYQQENAAIAIKSGGMLGKLITGDTGPRGTDYVPVSESDFIFSAIGEEFGFIGATIVILLYIAFVFYGIKIARKAKDYTGKMIAIGITSLIAIQAFVNIGVVTSLLPNTGIPLPFVSSGVTALLCNIATIGILLNISMQPKGFVKREDEINLIDRYI